MRRRILLLSVGMTTLVVLAFAVPLIILLRTSTANEAKDQARYRAEAAAYYVGDANHTADDITAYIDGLTNNGPGTISVRLPDGTTLGKPHPAGSRRRSRCPPATTTAMTTAGGDRRRSATPTTARSAAGWRSTSPSAPRPARRRSASS